MRSPHLLLDLGENGRSQKQVDEVRIELGSLSVGDRADCFLEAARVTVATPVGDGVEAVGDGDDARLNRDAPGFEAAWIAAAIPSLVVRGDSLCQVRIE